MRHNLGLPISFAPVRNAQLEMGTSADVDYMFDVPAILAQKRTGFRHDDLLDSEEDRFVILKRRE